MLNEIDLSRTDLNLLTLFEVVLEEGHVGRAAERLNLSASAVSHGLGRLRRLLNDPLFLRTPKGVVPTARATELAEPIAELLTRARRVISTAEPFDPATSSRRFTIGSPDGSAAVILPPLLAELRRVAPRIDVGVRQVLPPPGARSFERAWDHVLADLESRAMDVAVIPIDDIPARFVERTLYEEDFVIAMRAAHPFAGDPTLDRFCQMTHLVVSATGDAQGFVDKALAERSLTRRVALTVPNFMFAIAMVSETDLISALPRSFVAVHGKRFAVTSVEAPIPLQRYRIRAVMTKAAAMDSGVAWLFDLLGSTATPRKSRDKAGQPRHRRRPTSSAKVAAS